MGWAMAGMGQVEMAEIKVALAVAVLLNDIHEALAEAQA